MTVTKLLLRLFVKENAARGAIGKLSGLVGIVCNLLLFGFKLHFIWKWLPFTASAHSKMFAEWLQTMF